MLMSYANLQGRFSLTTEADSELVNLINEAAYSYVA